MQLCMSQDCVSVKRCSLISGPVTIMWIRDVWECKSIVIKDRNGGNQKFWVSLRKLRKWSENLRIKLLCYAQGPSKAMVRLATSSENWTWFDDLTSQLFFFLTGMEIRRASCPLVLTSLSIEKKYWDNVREAVWWRVVWRVSRVLEGKRGEKLAYEIASNCFEKGNYEAWAKNILYWTRIGPGWTGKVRSGETNCEFEVCGWLILLVYLFGLGILKGF